MPNGNGKNGFFKKLKTKAKIRLQEAKIERLQSKAVKKLARKKARAAGLRERVRQRKFVAREKERIRAELKLERFRQKLAARKAFLPTTVKTLEAIAKKSKSQSGFRKSLNLKAKPKKRRRKKQQVVFRF